MYRKTYVEIDGKILKSNIEEIISKYNNYKYYIGVVKGNAYGHGYYSIKYLIDGGINYLAVSSLEEAVSVREYNKDIPILCLEPINLEYINIIKDNNVTITVENLDYIKKLLTKKIKKIKVHLKLDTGMNRLGFKDKKELEEAVKLISDSNNIELEGIYTHLGTTGVYDIYYDKQINKFKELTKNINLEKIPMVHIGRSITLVNHDKLDFVNAIRLGVCMFGFNNSLPEPTGLRKLKRKIDLKRLNISDSHISNNLNVKTALSLYTEVMSLRKVKKGEFVGYSAAYIANEDIIVGTLPIGYYDGIREGMKYVCINNNRYEIIGEICMDMTTVLVDKKVKLHNGSKRKTL